MDQIIDTYISFLKNKKKDYANMVSPNYGYELLPPYTTDEIDEMCENKKINLPDILYDYLTKVSREIFFHDRPYLFNFNDIPDYEAIISNSFEVISNMNELKRSPLMVIISSTCDTLYCIYFSRYYYGSIWALTHNDMKLITDINTFFTDNIVNHKQKLYLLNSDDTINWTNFRLFMAQKKYNLSIENNTNIDLILPYNENILNEIIKSRDIYINTFLFNYLTKVSKELYINEHFTILNIYNIPSKNEIENMELELNDINIIVEYRDTYTIEDNVKEGNGNINEEELEKCMVRINNFYIYFGKGDMNCSIWDYSYDSNTYYCQFKNFEHYILSLIKSYI